MSRAARSTSVAILLLASLLLAGCIGTASLEGLLGRANSPAPTAVPRAEGSEETWPDGRPLGGTLRLSGGLPPTLDPAMAQDSTSAEYIVHLFSGLVRLDAELPQAYYALALCHRAMADPGRAMAAIDKAISLQPKFAPWIEAKASLYADAARYTDAHTRANCRVAGRGRPRPGDERLGRCGGSLSPRARV